MTKLLQQKPAKPTMGAALALLRKTEQLKAAAAVMKLRGAV